MLLHLILTTTDEGDIPILQMRRPGLSRWKTSNPGQRSGPFSSKACAFHSTSCPSTSHRGQAVRLTGLTTAPVKTDLTALGSSGGRNSVACSICLPTRNSEAAAYSLPLSWTVCFFPLFSARSGPSPVGSCHSWLVPRDQAGKGRWSEQQRVCVELVTVTLGVCVCLSVCV